MQMITKKNKKLKLLLVKISKILTRIFRLNNNIWKSWTKSKKLMRKWDIKEMYQFTWMFNAIHFLLLQTKFWMNFTFIWASICYYLTKLIFTAILRNNFFQESPFLRTFLMTFGWLIWNHHLILESQSLFKLT